VGEAGAQGHGGALRAAALVLGLLLAPAAARAQDAPGTAAKEKANEKAKEKETEKKSFLSGEVSLAVQTAALYRAERLTSDRTAVFVPSLSLTLGDLVTVWAEGSWDAHTQAITRKRGNHLLVEEKRYSEKSFGLSIAKDTQLAELSLDASVTQLADGAGTPKAGALSVVLHAPLAPALEVTRDIGGPGNWYFAPGLRPKVKLTDDLRVELAGALGYYSNATLQTRFFGGDGSGASSTYSGFSDATASATVVFEPGSFVLKAKALYATFLSEEVRQRVGQIGQPKSTLVGQLALGYSF
jgi:hypothetical protein